MLCAVAWALPVRRAPPRMFFMSLVVIFLMVFIVYFLFLPILLGAGPIEIEGVATTECGEYTPSGLVVKAKPS